MSENGKELRIEWDREKGTGEIEDAPCCPGAPDVTDCLGCPNCRGFLWRGDEMGMVPVLTSGRQCAETVRCAHPSFQEPTFHCPSCGGKVEIDEMSDGGYGVACDECEFYMGNAVYVTLERILKGDV